MKVEIWSDVMCPFCYIGKRKFEKALEQFEHREEVQVVWKSFQLNPEMKAQPGKNINQYLAEIKGWSLEQAKSMNDRVTEMAKAVGLDYHLDKAVVANSFDAHRLIQFAKKQGKGDELEEALFKAYFTEGKDTGDRNVLAGLAAAIGLDRKAVEAMFDSEDGVADVERDIYEAHQIGVRGVPFFVLGERYAVSGAQESATFLQALQKTWEELSLKNPVK